MGIGALGVIYGDLGTALALRGWRSMRCAVNTSRWLWCFNGGFCQLTPGWLALQGWKRSHQREDQDRRKHESEEVLRCGFGRPSLAQCRRRLQLSMALSARR
jgi:hypothetical protein